MTELGFALLALLAVAGSAALIVTPLVRRRASSPSLWATRNGAVAEEKTAVLDALRDLDIDYQLGSLTAEDYRQLQADLRRRALAALRAEDEQMLDIDEAIEQAVAAERARRHASPEQLPRENACPQCGEPITGSERFCPSCGALLAQVHQAAAITPAPSRRQRSARRGQAGPAVKPRALGPWLLGAAAALVVLALGVAWVVFNAPNRAAQAPIATVQAPDFHSLSFSPRRDGLVFLGTHNGLLASIDGGRTWGAQPVSGDVMAITHHPEDSLEVFLTGHEVFMKSADGGRAWRPFTSDLPSLDIHAFAVSPDAPYRLYAFVVGHGLFASNDGGSAWQRLSDQLPGSVSAMAAATSGHPALYLVTLDQGVLASDDGRSWRPANGVLSGALPTLRATSLAFDPRSGDSYVSSGGQTLNGALYAGTDRGLFKSIDGGSSWTRLSLESDVAALAVHPSDSRLLMVVDSRGRVFRSDDRGVTWPGDR